MKFKIESKKLLENISPILGIVPQRTPHNILKNHIKIKAYNNNIKLLTTDLDTVGESNFNIKLEKEGITVIPVKKLVDFLKKIPNSDIDIELENDKIRFIYNKGKFSLPVLIPDEYPEIPDIEPDFEFEIQGSKLKRMIDKTAFAINTIGVSSLITNGILWNTQEGKSEMLGINNHRFALYSMKLEENVNFKIFIPQKILLHISSFIENNNVKVLISSERIGFQIDNNKMNFTSRLLNYKVPNYSRLIFEDSIHTFLVNKKELIDVITRISIFSDTSSYKTKLNFKNNDSIEVSAESIGIGTAEETIDYKRLSEASEDCLIPINYHYLNDVLKAIDTENLVFKLNELDKALIIVPEKQRDREKIIYIMMPLYSKK